MKQPSYPCSCIICKKETSSLGIATHFMRSHGTQEEKLIFLNNITNTSRRNNRIKDYLNDPKLCLDCLNLIDYDNIRYDFCSRSCAANYSNRYRDPICYDLKPIKLAECNSCKVQSYIDPRRSINRFICDDCKIGYDRHIFDFKFNIRDYVDLFDINVINKIGWVSSTNKNGLSKDHKVSIYDAIENRYDPYYISHPCNCEIMPMTENIKKSSKSSITYQELVFLVNSYNQLKMG